MSNLAFFKDMCQQIQLDAMREGMRRAARIASAKDRPISQYTLSEKRARRDEQLYTSQAILTAAEQLTEKDLEV